MKAEILKNAMTPVTKPLMRSVILIFTTFVLQFALALLSEMAPLALQVFLNYITICKLIKTYRVQN